jgi:hypothetical protein
VLCISLVEAATVPHESGWAGVAEARWQGVGLEEA